MGNDCQWLICYRASVHGWSARSFHNKCDGKNNTVTIIQNGIYVFGGYTDIPWGEIVLTSSRIGSLCLGFVLFVCLFFNDILPGEMAQVHGAALIGSNGISYHEVRSVAGTNEFVDIRKIMSFLIQTLQSLSATITHYNYYSLASLE